MIPAPLKTWLHPERRIGKEVHLFDELPSTNDAAAALAHDRENHGLAILARHQSAGRGQHGRVWQAPADSSLLCSIVVPPLPAFQRPAIITAWAAVSIAKAIHSLTGATPRMKWPNDLLVEGRKICGILIETGGGSVVGFGLNLNQTEADFQAAGLPMATSLQTLTGKTFGIRETFEAVAVQLELRFRQIQRGELEELKAEWIEQTELLGHDVCIEKYDGSIIVGMLSVMDFSGLSIDDAPSSLAPETIRHIHIV